MGSRAPEPAWTGVWRSTRAKARAARRPGGSRRPRTAARRRPSARARSSRYGGSSARRGSGRARPVPRTGRQAWRRRPRRDWAALHCPPVTGARGGSWARSAPTGRSGSRSRSRPARESEVRGDGSHTGSRGAWSLAWQFRCQARAGRGSWPAPCALRPGPRAPVRRRSQDCDAGARADFAFRLRAGVCWPRRTITMSTPNHHPYRPSPRDDAARA